MSSELILYQIEDGQTKIQTRLENETVWLTQDQMALLFGKAKSNINEHIKNIYEEKELEENTTMKKFGNSEFQQKAFNYYNLDVIISVGYRVKNLQGTKFRQWATARLREYLVKGFTMNDELLKQAGGAHHHLNGLLQLCTCFSQAPLQLFTAKPDDRRLFNILVKSYSAARYQPDFVVSEQDAISLCDKVAAFTALATQLGEDKIRE